MGRVEKLVSSVSDDELQSEVAPGRNRVYYIVGHLAAHHDLMLAMLGLGQRLYPQLDELFITNPDRMLPDEISAGELRKMLSEVNAKITTGAEAIRPADLLLRHEAVSAEDFAKEPLRNGLSIFETRTAHAMFHAGQIRIVVKPLATLH